jgi:hypothetical protein
LEKLLIVGSSARPGLANNKNNTGHSSNVNQFGNLQQPNQVTNPQRQTQEVVVSEPKEGEGESQIIIHVCDENRNINKDFKCNKEILISQMKYFEKFTQGTGTTPASTLEDLDISVHCDIQIFEWLMKYLKSPIEQARSLETGSVISILISAEYLQMPRLVDECVSYMKNNLMDIIKLPIDLNCITSSIVRDLVAVTPIEELDEIKDRKDKLISRLYMKKLELMISVETNTLFRCIYCNKLFTIAQKSWMICSRAKIFIDFHGTVIAEHVADRSWDVNKFIHYLRQQGNLSWREIYWKI